MLCAIHIRLFVSSNLSLHAFIKFLLTCSHPYVTQVKKWKSPKRFLFQGKHCQHRTICVLSKLLYYKASKLQKFITEEHR